MTTSNVTVEFTKALPKAELHAHLSGSISTKTLHEIWLRKQRKWQCLDLENPLTAIKSSSQGSVNITTFFPLFDKYIYTLVNDIDSVRYATESVLEHFEADGVRYLELRSTPRSCSEMRAGWEGYVRAITEVVSEWNRRKGDIMAAHIVLSIDRRMTAEEAMEVVDLAVRYQFSRDDGESGYVVGVDMCGNPMRGEVSIFTPAFQKAKASGLGITVHFAEVPQSSSHEELETILSWKPDRLSHCIHVPPDIQRVIHSQHIGLELCLSCNVLAELTTGGFGEHHLKQWLQQHDCAVALCTDDVGIFGSPLSREFLIAAEYFHLSCKDVIQIARQTVSIAFAGRARMSGLIDEFEAAQER